MSFSEAANKIVQYQEQHAKALSNEQPMAWSSASLGEVDKVFDPTEEASKYYDEYVKTEGTAALLIKHGAQLGWMSGAWRDVRAQFLSCHSGKTDVQTARSGPEFCRYAFEMGTFFMYKLKGIINRLSGYGQ